MVIYNDIIPTGQNSFKDGTFHVLEDAHAASRSNHDYVSGSIVGSREWMRRKEVEMEARRSRVKEVCEKYDSKKRWREKEQGKKFWFDLRHRFAFCAHPKVWLAIEWCF